MTGGLIFKMELFKFLQDKKYLLAVLILAVLNTLTALFYSVLFTTTQHLGSESFLMRFSSVMTVVFVLLIFANGIFLFLFPFHVLSIDYKNNVMAMMIASGVNRSKLFFAKIGAVILLSLAVFIAVMAGPLVIGLVQMAIGGQINEFFASFVEIFNLFNLDIDVLAIVFSSLLSVLNSVVMITAATILMKGRNTAILVSIGFSMANSFISNFFNIFGFSTDISASSVSMVQGMTAAVSIAIFIFIGLRALQTQNL
ncbi:hypothetical protein I6N95_26255 [Vagococcus sp. BWB3-3]|uniref:Uncharacterized protein n=1 Tax=Vagococcus allomyrinae TaxID=2794353 RepID=A0A940SUN7_9ENTE|nr:hypothetical protein [Vagococcus allomyrinae]MBP1044517.1 hypothetical protein [Vagococcus allomyrinae]